MDPLPVTFTKGQCKNQYYCIYQVNGFNKKHKMQNNRYEGMKQVEFNNPDVT